MWYGVQYGVVWSAVWCGMECDIVWYGRASQYCQLPPDWKLMDPENSSKRQTDIHQCIVDSLGYLLPHTDVRCTHAGILSHSNQEITNLFLAQLNVDRLQVIF